MVSSFGTGVSKGEGLKAVQAGEFGDLTKADTLRVMAASHVILAVVLIGMDLRICE